MQILCNSPLSYYGNFCLPVSVDVCVCVYVQKQMFRSEELCLHLSNIH